MPLFQVRLESQTDAQYRIVTLDAADVDAAAAAAELAEDELVAFTIDDADELAFADEVMTVDEHGKVQGPLRSHARARWHVHHQEQPYKVVSVEPQLPNVAQIIGALKGLQEHESAWERTLQALRDAGLPLAAVSASLYGKTAQTMIDGSAPIVWSSATIKVALTTNAYTPDPDTHDFFNDVTNEITGTGYTAGGATLGTKTSTYDTATDQVRLDAADTTWTTSTLTARRAVVWNDTAGASSTDPVMGWVDFGADVSTTAGTFQITWDATGIIVYDVT